MTTDKKLGLERFQGSIVTKQTLPALICQMQRAMIILHVKRVSLKHVQLSNSFLIGRKPTVNVKTCRLYNNHVKVTSNHVKATGNHVMYDSGA